METQRTMLRGGAGGHRVPNIFNDRMERTATFVKLMPQRRFAARGGGAIGGGICTGLALTFCKHLKADDQGFRRLDRDNPTGLLLEAQFLHQMASDEAFLNLDFGLGVPAVYMAFHRYYAAMAVHCNLTLRESKTLLFEANRSFQQKLQRELTRAPGYYQIVLPNHTLCAINKGNTRFLFYDPAFGVAIFRGVGFMALAVAQHLCDPALLQGYFGPDRHIHLYRLE